MRTLIFLLISFISISSFAQGGTNINDVRNIFDTKGDYYFNKDDYNKAIVYYNMAYARDTRNYYSILRKAEAYTALELYPQAAECYRIVFDTDLRIANAYRLQYALVLLELERVKDFETWLAEYNELVETETRGKNYIATADDRAKLYKDTTIIFVDNVTAINTAATETEPLAWDDQVLFATDRASSGTNTIYSASYAQNGTLGKANEFNKSIASSRSEGSIAFFDVTNSMYFSRSDSRFSNLNTYESFIPMEPNEVLEVLPVSIEGISNFGQVCFNSTGTKIYFTAKGADSKGGFDLYSADFENGMWINPTNLGNAVNTSGDELYPFVYNDTVLYFSSNGHGGLGGFDLFNVNLNKPEGSLNNLGKQINSSSDDLALKMNTDGTTAYFASDRPGGKGKEDIYRAHILDLQIKYAYQHRVRTNIEDDKINLYLSNGDEYNIASDNNTGFNFSFLPQEPYKMVIQHENIEAKDALGKGKKEFLNPEAIQTAEVQLEAGMKYLFTAGLEPLSQQYVNELNAAASGFQDPGTSTIDLTALAKELSFAEGELYTIRFVKDAQQSSTYKAKGESNIYINDQTVGVFGQSFFIVLPLDNEAKFNIATDIDYLKENFNAKKYGVVVEHGAVFKDMIDGKYLISMLVNTNAANEVQPVNQLKAEDISIIPGSEYILTLSKKDPDTGKDVEIFVPLTKGVKYNLGGNTNTQAQFQRAFAAMVLGREDLEPSDEEIIDISILSKELEFVPGEDFKFNLLPAKVFGKNAEEVKSTVTKLTLDGKEYVLNRSEKYTINLPFDTDQALNIQTDIDYILDNFEMEDIVMALDTIPFFGAISVDTAGISEASADWLSVSVNTESVDEVAEQNKLITNELSIIPGKEYILTVSKTDANTGKETEIIVPLTRKVKYDFTSRPISEEDYQLSLQEFLESQDEYETTGGELIDISMLSKELEIVEGDEVSFSLLPAKVFKDGKIVTESARSSLYLDQKVVEFTQIQKYTINIPLEDQQVNIQTDIDHIKDNFEPGTFSLDVDTVSFFSEISIDPSGYEYMVVEDPEITDPVFDVIVVNFDLDDYSLRPKAVYTLDGNVVEELQKDERLYVTIKGYTDGLGNADYNEELSRKRAQSVKDYLQQMGIGESRIRTFSFGDSHTLKEGINWEDLSEEELEKHRKVEIVIYLPE